MLSIKRIKDFFLTITDNVTFVSLILTVTLIGTVSVFGVKITPFLSQIPYIEKFIDLEWIASFEPVDKNDPFYLELQSGLGSFMLSGDRVTNTRVQTLSNNQRVFEVGFSDGRLEYFVVDRIGKDFVIQRKKVLYKNIVFSPKGSSGSAYGLSGKFLIDNKILVGGDASPDILTQIIQEKTERSHEDLSSQDAQNSFPKIDRPHIYSATVNSGHLFVSIENVPSGPLVSGNNIMLPGILHSSGFLTGIQFVLSSGFVKNQDFDSLSSVGIVTGMSLSSGDIISSGTKSYADGYDMGKKDGYALGKKEGYAGGRKEGYAEGYKEGYSAGYKAGRAGTPTTTQPTTPTYQSGG